MLTQIYVAILCHSELTVSQIEFSACPGDRLNMKMSSYQYRDPYVKDKTVSWLSYL